MVTLFNYPWKQLSSNLEGQSDSSDSYQIINKNPFGLSRPERVFCARYGKFSPKSLPGISSIRPNSDKPGRARKN